MTGKAYSFKEIKAYLEWYYYFIRARPSARNSHVEI